MRVALYILSLVHAFTGCAASITGNVTDYAYDGVSEGQLRLFLSNTELQGDFALSGNAITLVDALCASDASENGLIRTYRAIFSVPGSNIRDRLSVNGQVYVITATGAQLVADSLSHLFGATAKNLYRTPGVRLNGFSYNQYTITGTTSLGDASSSHCTNWTTTLVSTASIGHSAQVNGSWLGTGLGACSLTRAIYCISQ